MIRASLAFTVKPLLLLVACFLFACASKNTAVPLLSFAPIGPIQRDLNPPSKPLTYHIEPALLDLYQSSFSATMQQIRSRVRPHLEDDHKAILDQVTFELEDSWDVYGTRAMNKDGKLKVLIPVGVIAVLDSVISAQVVTSLTNQRFDLASEFVLALADRLKVNSARHRLGQETLPVPIYPHYLYLSRQELDSAVSSPQFVGQKVVGFESALAFLFLHELAHHIWPNESIYTREIKADIFAINLAAKLDMNPILNSFPFIFFMGLEGEQFKRERIIGYAPVVCRAIYGMEVGYKAASMDKDFMKFIESNGGSVNWNSYYGLMDKLESLLDKDQVACESFEQALKKRPNSPLPIRLDIAERKLKIERPAPGSCNGFALSLFINDKFVTRVNNTRDPNPIELGNMKVGEYNFRFSGVSNYCIRNDERFSMSEIKKREYQCAGKFTVDHLEDLHLISLANPENGELHCGIY
ncbi:MAG: hypothetical protein C9356_02795 [Oleiphilus sp.]|nr:MAG: hypothetical protein C9356_02795 [Oleiphilus sp.]